MKNRQTILLGIGVGIGIALVFLLTFFVGVYSVSKGFKDLPFWERKFGVHKSFLGGPRHGVIGTVESVEDKKLLVSNRNGLSKTIFIDDQTIIRGELKKGEKVLVIGEPQGEAIKARVIRVLTHFVKDASESGRSIWIR